MKKIDVNYKYILDFLNNYGGNEYKDSEKLSGKEKEKFQGILNEGKQVAKELKNISKYCEGKYKLEKVGQLIWQHSGRIRDYLWLQLKYKKYKNMPISISIFVEKENMGIYRYRVCLELKEKDNSIPKENRVELKEKWKKIYHSHLEIPKGEDMKYTLGSNEKGTPEFISDNINSIKNKISNGEYDKVQISICIENTDEKSNEEYHNDIVNAVGMIIPYYERVNDELEEDSDIMKQNISRGETTNEIIFDKNIILYGPPGTGKTYNTIYYAVAICENKDLDTIKKESYTDILKRYNDYKNDGKIEFTTFHQSYGYEEFIEGIKPRLVFEDESKKIENSLEYSIIPGIFKKFCDKAKEGKQNDKGNGDNFVFIIDEINRGNISKIFGELITLIEDTKREGENEHTSVRLPYSQTLFSVPNNVYIIGTMNTADRSISLMDTALRRRFQFIEMLPNFDIGELKEICIKDSNNIDSKINVEMMLKKINERIEILYDREHTIGHAMFLRLVQNPTIEVLASIFKKSIIPLLQEYFYEDYEKIQLILGDNGKEDNSKKFILEEKIEIEKIFNGFTDNFDIPNKKYSINKEAFDNQDSYKQIYEKVKKDE